MHDSKWKVLEGFANAADEIADEHETHVDCGTTPLMRDLSDTIRRGVAAGMAASRGPAQVATAAYRNNWDTLFGKKQTVGQA